MHKVVYKKCLFLVIFVASTLLQCFFAQTPCDSNPMQNAVVYRGSSFSFPDLYPSDNVKWQVAPSSLPFLSLQDITDYDNTIKQTFNGVYNVSSSELTILNATMAEQGANPYATAGLYLADYQDHGCTIGAALTVVDNPPTCSLDISEPSSPKLSCSITFANYVKQQIKPTLKWVDSSGKVVQSDTPERDALDGNNEGLQRSTSVLFVSPGDTSQYDCVVTFNAPDDPELPAILTKSTPNFTANCYISSTVTTIVPTTTTAPTTTTPPVTTTTKLSTASTTVAATTSPHPTTIAQTSPPAATEAPLVCTHEKLQNTVVYKGQQTSFLRVDGQPVQWKVGPSDLSFSSLQDITDSNGNFNTTFSGTYAVIQSNLIILDSTLAPEGNKSFATAGIYVLFNSESCAPGAGLTVVDSDPVCSVDPNNFLSCSINFSNYDKQVIAPIMTWTDSSGKVVQTNQQKRIGLDIKNLGLQMSTDTFKAPSGDATQYRCQVAFSAPSPEQPPFLATNAPTFNGSCNVTGNPTTTVSAKTTATTTTATVIQQTGTITVPTATASIQISTASPNPPITNTAVTPSSTLTTTAQLQTGTVGYPASTTTSTETSPPASTVSPSESTGSLSSFAGSSGSTVSISSSSGSTSPAASQPSTVSDGPITITNSLPTLVNQNSTVSSLNSSLSVSSATTSTASSPTTTKALSLTTAALSISTGQITDDPQAQATSIVLGLVLGSLVTTGLVSAFWCYCCFFPIGAKGAKRRERILLVRRKFLFWRNEPPVEDIYRRSYPPVGRTFQSREPVAPENPWRYPALRKTFHWREPNENGNFWRWDPAANDPYSRRDFNAMEI